MCSDPGEGHDFNQDAVRSAVKAWAPERGKLPRVFWKSGFPIFGVETRQGLYEESQVWSVEVHGWWFNDTISGNV